jgi:hypothetical protein
VHLTTTTSTYSTLLTRARLPMSNSRTETRFRQDFRPLLETLAIDLYNIILRVIEILYRRTII